MTHYAVKRVAHGVMHSISTFWAHPTKCSLASGYARDGTRAHARLGPIGTWDLCDYSRYNARARASHLLARGVSFSCQACSFHAHLRLVQTVLMDGRSEHTRLDTGTCWANEQHQNVVPRFNSHCSSLIGSQVCMRLRAARCTHGATPL